VSEGIYASLNGGRGSSDDPASVEANRTLAALDLGVSPDSLLSLHQIHSATVVEAPWTGDPPRADGMVTRKPGVGLAVLTADCAPILLADSEAGVIGAVHAGWRGALNGVIGATVEAMTRLGARPGAIRAAIGPCISQQAYEVGHDFMMTFCDDDPAHARFFAGAPGEKPHFELPGFCLQRLREAGVEQCGWVGHCTYGDEARFYSYRRATHRGEADYGRLMSAITLPEP
jgi:YfiH family protein